MNTADRSIALVDAALRRRFYFQPFFPDTAPVQGLLRRWLTREHPGLSWVADAVDEANKKLADRNAAIGPSHFLKAELTERWVYRIWEHAVLPYIEEHFFGEDQRVLEFSLDRLRGSGGGAGLNDDGEPDPVRLAMPEVVLTEYQTLEGVALRQSECDGLRRAVTSLRVQPTLGRSGCYDLTPSATVGALEVGSLSVIIRPKIPIDRLMFLVSYSLDPKAWADTPFEHGEAKSIVDAVVPAFVFHVRRAVKRGLLQQYRLEEDALQTIRGRLDVGRHVSRRFGLAPPIEVSFDEFTEDHLLNRLIKAALLALECSVVRSGYARRLLHAVLPLFERVQSIPVDVRRLPAVHYTRLNRHYRPAVEFARLILRGCAFEHQHGTAPSRAFLLDMNEVFESFVVVALREELKVSADVLAQGRGLPLDVDQRVTLRPDLSWWERGRPVFVGDVNSTRRWTSAGISTGISISCWRIRWQQTFRAGSCCMHLEKASRAAIGFGMSDECSRCTGWMSRVHLRKY